MDDHQARARRNETLFRSVNDQLENLNQAFARIADGAFDIVCECAAGTCVEQLPIPSAEYARIRADPTLYILLAGHEDPTIETVVEENQPYLVVRKPAGEPPAQSA